MISRNEATEVLYELISSGILDGDIEYKLNEIASCIDYERHGMHLWNATDEDCETLFTCKRADTVKDEDIKYTLATVDKYRFVPAPAEKKEIEDTKEDS